MESSISKSAPNEVGQPARAICRTIEPAKLSIVPMRAMGSSSMRNFQNRALSSSSKTNSRKLLFSRSRSSPAAFLVKVVATMRPKRLPPLAWASSSAKSKSRPRWAANNHKMRWTNTLVLPLPAAARIARSPTALMARNCSVLGDLLSSQLSNDMAVPWILGRLGPTGGVSENSA